MKPTFAILTVSSYDMYKDIEEKLAQRRGTVFEGFVNGLPVGLKLPNGVIVGA